MPETLEQRARKILDIDPLKLDREWEEQAALYFSFAVDAAEAHAAVDRAKAELELVESEVDMDVRLNPEKYGVDKITETAVKSAVQGSKRRRKAYEDLVEKRHAAKIADAAVAGLEHKKRALEKLVDMRIAGLYAQPHTSREGREDMNENAKRRARRPMRRDEE